MPVNQKRLLKNLNELAEYGNEGEGINRFAFTTIERKALKYIKSLMEECNMKTEIDDAGNLIGKYQNKKNELPSIIMGSHIDTVPAGGKFDGSIGVIGGIEVIRSLHEDNFKTKYPLEVIVFSEEEGSRFPLGLFGSYAFSSGISYKNISNIFDKDNISLSNALQNIGLNPINIKNVKRKENTIKNYIELHIEQGRVLEEKNMSVGIVTGIAGQFTLKGKIKGIADHAGSTPMKLRKDALAAAAEIILESEKIANTTGKNTVATIGSIDIKPNASNIIPGEVVLYFDIRDINEKTRIICKERILNKFKTICSKRNVIGTIKIEEDYPSKNISKNMVNLISKVCRKNNIPVFKMMSGAIHDASNMADITDVGMIFVKSKDGISHSKNEYSSIEDITLGVELMKNVVMELSEN